MDRRIVSTLLVVALLALAGCSGGGGPGSPTAGDASDGTDADEGPATATDGDDTGTPTRTADNEPLDVASVTTDSGLNTTALLLAHSRTLNRSGGYRIEANRTIRAPEGTSIRDTVIEGATTPVRYRYLVTYTFENESGTFEADLTEQYRTADRYYRRSRTARGQTTHSVTETTRQRTRQRFRGGTIGFTEAGYYLMFDFAFEGNVTRDGTSLYRFSADSFAATNQRPRNATDPSATLLVDRTGVIRSADISFENANTGQELDLSMETVAVGDVAVAEPDWTDEAR